MSKIWTEHEIRNAVQKRRQEIEKQGSAPLISLAVAWPDVCMKMHSDMATVIAEQAQEIERLQAELERQRTIGLGLFDQLATAVQQP